MLLNYPLHTIATESKISNAEVRNICEQDDIIVELTRRKWCWVGNIHVWNKDLGNTTKEALFWTPDGKWKWRRPKKPGEEPQQKSWRLCVCCAVEPERRHRTGPVGELLWRHYASHGVKRTDNDDDDDDSTSQEFETVNKALD